MTITAFSSLILIDEVKNFVQKQVELTESVLKKCETRERLRKKLSESYDYPNYDTPFKEGDKYFYFQNSGLQLRKILYMEDAKYLAYGLSASGSDWVATKVMHVEDKRVESDTLSWVKFSDISWTNDSRGYFYSRYQTPRDREKLNAGTETSANLDHQLYYHLLGTEQSHDILCWQEPDNPKFMPSATVTEDGKRPDLFGCALAHVGVMDMFRFHKVTIGHA